MHQPWADDAVPRKLIDEQSAACLCDVGAPGYVAVSAVDGSGIESLWLIQWDTINDHDTEFGNPDQPHEQVGRLPLKTRIAVWGDALCCGRPTGRGKPCRREVTKPGDPCHQHRWAQ
jgi:hypothetical protein